MQDFNELLPFRHRVATYLSPKATPWVRKTQNTICALKGQFKNLNDVFIFMWCAYK